MQKQCIKCKKLREIEDFPKHKSYTSGRENKCKFCRTYYKDNKEKRKEKQKEYDQNNSRLGYHQEYQEIHRQESADRARFRYNNDIEFQTKNKLRVRIYNALKGKTKKGSTLELLGCSILEFRNYLESQFTPKMSWDNWGNYWEIDHILPCSSFNLIELEQQKECFKYSNCRPLTIFENRSKSNKII